MSVYEEFVAKRCKPGADIHLGSDDKHLMHMLLGLTGEVGELVDVMKKHLIYEQPLDCEGALEELGDIEFYLAGIRNWFVDHGGTFREAILAHNVRKLSRRYPDGYSNKNAADRMDKT